MNTTLPALSAMVLKRSFLVCTFGVNAFRFLFGSDIEVGTDSVKSNRTTLNSTQAESPQLYHI